MRELSVELTGSSSGASIAREGCGCRVLSIANRPAAGPSIFHERLHGTDEAVDEASVLTQEAVFLQRYISRAVLHLSTADRRFPERHIDQLRAQARRIVPSFEHARGPAVQEVIQ